MSIISRRSLFVSASASSGVKSPYSESEVRARGAHDQHRGGFRVHDCRGEVGADRDPAVDMHGSPGTDEAARGRLRLDDPERHRFRRIVHGRDGDEVSPENRLPVSVVVFVPPQVVRDDELPRELFGTQARLLLGLEVHAHPLGDVEQPNRHRVPHDNSEVIPHDAVRQNRVGLAVRILQDGANRRPPRPDAVHQHEVVLGKGELPHLGRREHHEGFVRAVAPRGDRGVRHGEAIKRRRVGGGGVGTVEEVEDRDALFHLEGGGGGAGRQRRRGAIIRLVVFGGHCQELTHDPLPLSRIILLPTLGALCDYPSRLRRYSARVIQPGRSCSMVGRNEAVHQGRCGKPRFSGIGDAP